jgi:CDP-alcohol phosphatidyltransferase-like enzyme
MTRRPDRLAKTEADRQVNKVQRVELAEIRERTYKKRDAWWTVLLVDPVASRLVRLVAPYRWITPNLLTLIATVLGLGAAACFAQQDRGWLIAGAVLFHLSFLVDCMDGKIARLNGTGSMFGAWFDFMFDRLRVIVCSVALFGGQYDRTGEQIYLWLAVGVVSADLFRYLNSSQMSKIKSAMRNRLSEVRGHAVGPPEPEDVSGEPADDAGSPAPMPDDPQQTTYVRVRNWLLRRRIRMHLVSGIEFEMFVFIIGPLTGWIIAVSIVSGILLLGMEAALVAKLWLATRRYPAQLAAAEAAAERATITTPLTPIRR